MAISNTQRNLVKLVQEIAKEQGLFCTLLSKNWIIKLTQPNTGKSRFIFGYNFELNSATARMLAQDKCAAAEVLQLANVPAVAHELFLHPRMQAYVGETGNWQAIRNYAVKHNYQLVCKPVSGTGGNGVQRVRNQLELEQVIHRLFAKHRSIAISPYYVIEQEFRVIMLDGEAEIIYAKEIPSVMGDGMQTVEKLGMAKYGIDFWKGLIQKLTTSQMPLNVQAIPALNEKVRLSWKHNLGLIAQPRIVRNELLKATLSKLAQQAQAAINIRFASIDIVEINGQWRVMEINAGIMVESFSRASPEAYALSKALYSKAIQRLFTA